MFEIVETSINNLEEQSLKILENPTVGGVVYFQGVVRNHNDGKDVTSLEYDAYKPMANTLGKQIVSDAKKKFDIEDAYCIHRIGHLGINDTAVWVVVTAHHRREAYEASQYIIDTVKGEVPIWKREHYVNEEPNWVACHHCKEHHEDRHGHQEHKHEHEHEHEHKHVHSKECRHKN